MYTPSANFNALVANIETLVQAVDYKGICNALVAHAKALGYVGRPFNAGFNTLNIKRWCKAESSDGRLQYVLAGLGSSSDRGRYTVLMQWDYLCCNNTASQVALRSLKDNAALIAGVARYYPKKDSSFGTVEARLAGQLVSTTAMPDKARKQAVNHVEAIETAKVDSNRADFENASLAVAAILAKYSKPVATKPETAKPEVAKPEVAKKGKGKARAA